MAAEPSPMITVEPAPSIDVSATKDSSLDISADAAHTAAPVICTAANDENAIPFAAKVIELTNVERAKVNAAPVTEQAQLTEAAQTHAFDMACNAFLSHIGSDGSSPFDRMIRFGYVFSAAAENVAAGYPTPADVVQGWMDSPGHRQNMLKPDYTNIGIGYAFNPDTAIRGNYFHYWVMTLGSPQ
jgi:uncharacterized protein YkwD